MFVKELNDKEMNYELIDNVEVAGINYNDAPDYVDAYIVSADYAGVPMTDEQLDEINEDSDFVYGEVMNWIFGG